LNSRMEGRAKRYRFQLNPDSDWFVYSIFNSEESHRLLFEFLENRPELDYVFRDNWRTLSAKITLGNEALLLKVPRARNARRWEQLLTLFRVSDAVRSFQHLEKMSSMGLPAPEPFIACEKRRLGVVNDAFVCYRFVDGRRAESQDAGIVLDALRKLHGLGYVRNDAQLANFLIQEGAAVFIDFRLKKLWLFPELKKAREIARFLRSCPEARRLLTTSEISSFWFRLAHRLEELSFAGRRFKRSIRKRKKVE